MCPANGEDLNSSADLMSDALRDGRALRTFNILDDRNRVARQVEVDVAVPAERVTRVDEQLVIEG